MGTTGESKREAEPDPSLPETCDKESVMKDEG
jgi:hypothetical protein